MSLVRVPIGYRQQNARDGGCEACSEMTGSHLARNGQLSHTQSAEQREHCEHTRTHMYTAHSGTASPRLQAQGEIPSSMTCFFKQ